MNKETYSRHQREAAFHDHWAVNTDASQIDVFKCNESITAVEMRYIMRKLGPLGGKKLIDVGCGLGEASVYFAIKGADVTSVDISEGMLQAVDRLAQQYQVKVKTVKLNIENIFVEDKFDIAYAGNLFHHVNIEETLKQISALLKDGGRLVSWDPLAYNPLIKIYRYIAKKVRTSDEHPLTLRDIGLFKKHFSDVEVRYFWFFTLIIFICMFIFQLRNPNQERFWKVVVDEGDKWAWLYKPLAALDRFILKLFPCLGLFCWNIVVIARKGDNYRNAR